MKAVITVLGRDKVGIIAGICTKLAELNINVLDINQTIMQNMFTMTMLVDTSGSKEEFSKLVDELKCEGERLNVNIRIQREDIFDAMHRI
ncbi:MAG: ACT domain-containing protein [Oscillospiraceae bacterium]|nr:ACT domain-containing protein [Oscillospiraceae bacterium]MDD7470137.1 ACT domain-containing protein [Oscillospiraceae bacterium]MDO4398614.1 ACT domain-containing protein [Oscillospiraceae bacterium]MDY2678642.1 ACT domain-containing protein [Oscillospiraceae bacterium]